MRCILRHAVFLLTAFIFFFQYGETNSADLVINKDTVFYNSDSLIYSKDGQQIIELFGNAKVKYKDMGLDAGYIKILVDSQKVLSSYLIEDDDTTQYPYLVQQRDTIYGKNIKYNLKSETGQVEYGQSKVENGYYFGEKLTSMERKRIYFTDSRYTTCGLVPEKQHYYFKIREMKVIPKDRVFARHIWMYINRVPYFYLPFDTRAPIQDSSGYFYLPRFPVFYFPAMVYPIRRDRHSGILFPKIGKENIAGNEYWVIKETGYYWAINDYTDYLFRFNFYSTQNLRFENQFRYKLRYRLNGDIRASYWTTETKKEYKFKINHSQEIDPTSRLTVSGNFVSNDQFYRYESDDYRDRVERKTSSNLLYSKRLDFGSITLNMNRDENFDTETISQKLPQYSFNMKQYEYNGFYLSYRHQALYYYNKRREIENLGENGETVPDTSYQIKKRYGAVHNIGLKKNMKWKTYLKINQSVNITETWFDYARNREGEKIDFVRAANYNYNLSLGNTLYGVFAPGVFGIKAIRHQLEPYITFSYRPADKDSSRIYESFSPVSYSPSRTGNQRVNFSLKNLFQAKLSGKDGKEKKIRLFTANLNTSYNKNATNKKWSDIKTTINIQPINWLDFRFNSSHDPYSEEDVESDSPFRSIPRLKSFSFQNNSRYDFSLPLTTVGPFFIPYIPLKTTAIPLGIVSLPFITFGKNEKGEKKEEQKPLDMKQEHSHSTQENKIKPKDQFYRVFEEDWEGSNRPDFKINLSHSYSFNKVNYSNYSSKSNIDEIHQLKLTVNWSFTKRWKLTADYDFDIKEREITRYSFKLHNDLHCWEFMFRYREEKYYKGYYFLLNIVDLPDIKIEQNRRFQ